MTTHRWTSTTRLKRHDTGEVIQPGEAFEPRESELRAFGRHIEELEDGASEPEIGEYDIPEGTVDDGDDETEVAFDADAWMDDHDGYQDRIETVESGTVDAVLDKIEDTERSEKVIEAVETRRDELEE